jgi:hypothetical protein
VCSCFAAGAGIQPTTVPGTRDKWVTPPLAKPARVCTHLAWARSGAGSCKLPSHPSSPAQPLHAGVGVGEGELSKRSMLSLGEPLLLRVTLF